MPDAAWRATDEECQANTFFASRAMSVPSLARRWDGVGPMPLSILFLLLSEVMWDDPAVLPSARARKFLRATT